MRLRGTVKFGIYNHLLRARAGMPVFGERVFFPPDSYLIRRACAEGVFEKETIGAVIQLLKPNGMFVDVGANVGLITIPILKLRSDVRALAIEACPNALPYLERTWWASSVRERWRVIGSAVADRPGQMGFAVARPALGAFDGLRPTGRVPYASAVTVQAVTLDEIWRQEGCPSVSVLKIDVEGAELGVIRGGQDMIRACKPAIVMEVNPVNMSAYGEEPGEVLYWARSGKYQVVAIPSGAIVERAEQMRVCLASTEMFALIPS